MTLQILLMVLLRAQSIEPPVLPAGAKAVEVTPGGQFKLKYHFLAMGKQIYKCDNGGWAKSSTPEATLVELGTGLKVKHFAGPSWTIEGDKGTGSVKATGSKAVHYAAPDGVSIDWLKLETEGPSATGDFSDIGIIQRLYTGGGKALATGCSANQVYESPYTAHYYFWSSK